MNFDGRPLMFAERLASAVILSCVVFTFALAVAAGVVWASGGFDIKPQRCVCTEIVFAPLPSDID